MAGGEGYRAVRGAHRLRRPRQLRAPGVLAREGLRLLGRRRRAPPSRGGCASAPGAATPRPRLPAPRQRRDRRLGRRLARSRGRRPGTSASTGASSGRGRSATRTARAPDAPYSKRPSRSHFVATHFSPAITGAPPCSVRVDGCGAVVAEEDGVAAHRRDLEADVGEDRARRPPRACSGSRRASHALAAALQDRRRAGLGRVEVVVVRLVLGARAGSAGSAGLRRSRAASRAARRCAPRCARRRRTRRARRTCRRWCARR